MRRSPLKRRSNNKKAVTKVSLGRVLSEWVRAEGVCAKCGRRLGADYLHAHHIVTRGADKSLLLCPDNLMPLCGIPNWLGVPSCHDQADSAEFRHWLAVTKPGLKDYLRFLGRTTWFKKDLDEVEKEIREATKRPWSERFKEVAA